MSEEDNREKTSIDDGETSKETPPPPPGYYVVGESESQEKKGDPKKRFKIVIIAVCIAVLVVAVVAASLFASHVICIHEWEDATCKTPKTCTVCGKTEGFARGHDYQEETCAKPKICKNCGFESGKPNDSHTVKEWTTDKEPTCAEAGEKHGACSVCGKTITGEVPKASHTEGEWAIVEDFSISSSGAVVPGKKILTCSVCGAEMKAEEYTTTLTMGQKNALKKAASYLSFTSFSYSGLVDQLEYEGFSNEDSVFAVDHCGADWNAQAAKKAESYLEFTSFSREGLIDQLEYEGFTYDQAVYGVSAVGY